MQKLSELMGKTLERSTTKDPKKKKPPHEKSATVDLIQNAGLVTKTYGYTYWLSKVKRAGVTYNDILGIIKEVQGMDAKYNKGGRLTNLLTEKANSLKKKNGRGTQRQGTKSVQDHGAA